MLRIVSSWAILGAIVPMKSSSQTDLFESLWVSDRPRPPSGVALASFSPTLRCPDGSHSRRCPMRSRHAEISDAFDRQDTGPGRKVQTRGSATGGRHCQRVQEAQSLQTPWLFHQRMSAWTRAAACARVGYCRSTKATTCLRYVRYAGLQSYHLLRSRSASIMTAMTGSISRAATRLSRVVGNPM